MSAEVEAAPTTTGALDAFEYLHEVVHAAAGRDLDEEYAAAVLRAATAYVSEVFNAADLAAGRVSRRRPLLFEVRELLRSLGANKDDLRRATQLYSTPEEIAQELAERTIVGCERGEWGPWFLDATLDALLGLEQIDTTSNSEAARERLRASGWRSLEYVGYSEHPEHEIVVAWHHPDLPRTPPVHTDIDEDALRVADLTLNMKQTLTAWRDVPERPKVPTKEEERTHTEMYVSRLNAFLVAREQWLRLAFHRGDPGPLVAPVWGVSEEFPGSEAAAESVV